MGSNPRLRALLLFFLGLFLTFASVHARAQGTFGDSAMYNPLIRSFLNAGMWNTPAYDLLKHLVHIAPHRLSGSQDAARAVAWVQQSMQSLKFEKVHQESITVPHWVRGKIETARILGRHPYPLEVCALGKSVATPAQGIAAEVVEVHSLAEAKALGTKGKGKIIFFNRPMDATLMDTFEAYENAVDQRGGGAIAAASVGGVAALVRSMTMRNDRVPHTGVMGYVDSIAKVPAAAVSLVGADTLSARIRRNPHLRVRLVLTCRTLPDAPSANVMGQITGSEFPNEIIVISGHVDCWDKGEGAVDDGSGVVQALEALRLIKSLGLHPKRTIRAVGFMNEENGSRGGIGYARNPARTGERHIAAIESDRGGFTPRGFFYQVPQNTPPPAPRLLPALGQISAGYIRPGFSGVDILPLVDNGVPGFGLDVDSQRYFDYHHSDNDRLSAINPRELELGAIAEALLGYILAEGGLQSASP